MRCPFRMKAFDMQDTCDPDCAWLVTEDGAHCHARMCALTALAVDMGDGTIYAVNFDVEPRISHGAQA